jgi:hypothetical protein
MASAGIQNVVPWFTIAAARAQVAELTQDCLPEQRQHLAEIERFLVSMVSKRKGPGWTHAPRPLRRPFESFARRKLIFVVSVRSLFPVKADFDFSPLKVASRGTHLLQTACRWSKSGAKTLSRKKLLCKISPVP